LTPNQVKFRLMYSARPAFAADDDLAYNIFQQGMGRLWIPDALFGDFFPARCRSQPRHGYLWRSGARHRLEDLNGDGMVDEDELDPLEMAYHYAGPIYRLLSDDGRAYLYYLVEDDGTVYAMGAAWADYNGNGLRKPLSPIQG
jgi:hypothetical protein